MDLLQYILAIIIVILVLTGFAILAVFLRPKEEKAQQSKEKAQEKALGVDDPSTLNSRPKRSLLDIFRRSERTMG